MQSQRLKGGHSERFYQPIDDEAVTFGAAASAGLTAAKVDACEIVVIRFINGEGRLRFTSQDPSDVLGVPVAAGDIEVMNRFEAISLKGIRVGVTDLTGWATYYK